MSNPKRVDKGIPTGGEFTTRQRADSAAELIAASRATSATAAVDELLAAVHAMEIHAVAADIEAETLVLFPTATAATFTRDSFGFWNFSHVSEGDQPLTAAGGKFFDNNPEVYKLDDAVSHLLKRFGNGSKPIDMNVIGTGLRLEFDTRQDIAEIDQRLKGAVKLYQSSADDISALSVQAIAESLRAQYPTATRLWLVEGSYDNGVFFSACAVLNANGDALWDAAESEDLDDHGIFIESYLSNLRQEDLSEADPGSIFFVDLI